VALGFVLARHRDRVVANAGGAYACPMHPEVTAGAPGECPICGMALLKAGTFSREEVPALGGPMAADRDDAVAAAEILSKAAGGVAPNLLGYYPSPLRKHMLRYEVYAPAWVEKPGVVAALLYGDQLPSLEPGEHAVLTPTTDPATQVEVALAFDAPEPWDRSMSLVRLRPVPTPPPAPRSPRPSPLPPGTVGWVKFAPRSRPMDVIPANAVLQSPAGPYVLVFARDRGTVTKRAVEIGRTTTGVAAVLSGLAPREMVVSVNAFFWDAERRLHADPRAGGGAGP
jgi:hypothetical protein